MGPRTTLFENLSRWFAAFLALILLFLITLPSPSFADDFAVRNIGDYGNVTVMTVTGNYDADNPDGTVNAAPRQAIAKEFFKTHKDEYDFIVVFTNFDFKMPAADVDGFYEGVRNDIKGIGTTIFDNTSFYGSNGKLQGTIDMGNLAGKVSDPLDPRFEQTLDVLAHEMLHRWCARVKFSNASGNASTALLGKDGSHWSYLLDTKGSLEYGNQWHDNGNGTFTSGAARKYYSSLDLYLMGMIDKSRVPPMLLIDNPAIDPAKLPEVGVTISGTPRTVTIDDIIAAEGERVPAAKDSQKQFKMAFILITAPGTFTGQELNSIENVRNGFLPRYSILTDGKGLVQVASTPLDNLPVNPGTQPPVIIPRTLPPNIEDGVQWLMANQQADGSWTDFALTTERDTAETVTTLQQFPSAAQAFQSGFTWLGSNASANTDYLARRIETTVRAGGDATSLIQSLVGRMNGDGGWGSGRNFTSNAADTALVLKALGSADYGDQGAIGKAIAYLQGAQNQDGGWSGGDAASAIQPTVAVIGAFNVFRRNYSLDGNITKAVAFLTAKQNPDGGFGNSPSTIYDSALAIIALQSASGDKTVIANGLNYLLEQQSGDGSWLASPYQTALAVRAVWQATITPDLSIKPADISIIPTKITAIPTTAVLSATIRNLGRTDVTRAKVAVYDGGVSLDKKVAEQFAAFPGQSPVTLTFSISVTDGKGHVYYVVADPDNQVSESNRSNNTASITILPDLTYDFQVLASDISVSPNPADMGASTKITVKTTNGGTSDAFSVPVRIFIDQPGAPFDIATLAVDIPAGGSVVKDVTWKAVLAGSNMPLTVRIDPNNAFTETNKDNNKASAPITVNASTLPNLSVSYKDMVITPAPAREGGNASISVLVKNDGYSTAENIKVNFYVGVVGEGGVLLGSQVISSIAAGQGVPVSVNWNGIGMHGTQIITVQADPDNTIQEISKDDNFTFLSMDVLSLPDLAVSPASIDITPATPKTGETVTITVTVQNGGDQEAHDVAVQVKEGGAVIGNTVIPLINGNSQATGAISYANSGQTGTRQITVTVDPDGLIIERTKDNNTATRSFSIQDANLSLTEPYFSPNGDGIKDTTDFSFRLAAPAQVSVQIVNKNGVTVRTFSGGDLNNTAGSTITWDGKNDAGAVVDDGTYQIKVVAANGAVLASLPVEVDTNRSSLAEALGTKYLLQSNQTCALPNYGNLEWLPGESGLVFQLGAQNNSPYLDGLYYMSPAGENIIRLIPELWNSISNPGDKYKIINWDMSPDGQKIAFILEEDKGCRTGPVSIICDEEITTLWMVNTDGSKLTLLKKYEYYYDYPYAIKWSPDGRHLALMSSWIDVISIFDMSTMTESAGHIGFESPDLDWSPDGSFVIATTGGVRYAGWAAFTISDVNGMGFYIYMYHPYSLDFIGLMQGNKYLFRAGFALNDGYLSACDPASWSCKNIPFNFDANSITMFNPADGSFKRFADLPIDDYAYLSPDKHYVYWYDQGASKINVIDNKGNATVLSTGESGLNDSLIKWSQDDSALAYVYTSYNQQDQLYHDEMVIHNMDDGSKRRVEISSYADSRKHITRIIAWMKNDVDFLLDSGEGIFSFNSGTGTHSDFLPLDNANFISFSPNERYLTYEVYGDSSGSCFPKGYEHNQWAMSSLLNLTADLRVTKNKSIVRLSGIASDKNFAGYRLEYADIKTPGSWNLIMPPSDVPVLNDKFTDWVPPYEGTFLVRLTAWDKAGNQTVSQRKVMWGISTLVMGLYIDNSVIAPKNPDNPKKSVTLHYTALDAVHLEFTIVNDKGDTVRSFIRDHAGYANDSIAWDGLDSAGNPVPDGKYRIRLFDYEFIVEVDNTFPVVTIGLSGIQFDTTRQKYTVTLSASATDSRLKKWTIQTGNGENPTEWTDVDSGTDNLQNYSNKYIDASDIASLKQKKFRIVAEDATGNQSVAVGQMVESKVVLALIRDPSFNIPITPATISVNTDLNGYYNLIGFETVWFPTQKLALQLSTDISGGWQDVQEQSNSGYISFPWQKPANIVKPFALRFKEVTEGGMEYYSNQITFNESFYAGLKRCFFPYAFINLYENLKQLKIKVTSSSGLSISRVSNYDGNGINSLITGLETPVEKDYPTSFAIQMTGVGLSGKTYYWENTLDVPKSCSEKPNDPSLPIEEITGGGTSENPTTLPFDIIYPEAQACGSPSGQILLPTNRLNLTGVKLVDYLVKVTNATKVIGEVNIATEGPLNVTVAPSLLPEGSYPLSVLLTKTDNSQKQIDLGKVVVFDTEAPTAQLTLPATPCPARISSPRGVRLGIDVSGSASDNIRVDHYALYYGAGTNPASWSPAMAVPDNSGASKPISGNGPVSGKLGTMDITDIPGSVFTLRLEVVDGAGNKGCATAVMTVNRGTNLSGYNVNPLVFSPNGDGFLDIVTAGFNVDQAATLDLSVFSLAKDVNGVEILGALMRHAQSGLKINSGAASYDWDGKGDTGTVLPDSRYGVSITVTDTCGNGVSQWKAVELDNTPPVTSIDYPLPGNPLPPGVMIEVKGTATDPHFKNYLLEAGEGDSPTTWTRLAGSTSQITGAVIASWNTFGLKDHWTLRLTAEDSVGNKKIVTSTIDLGVRKELVKSFDATPRLFSPNNDQKLDTTAVTFEVTDACNVQVDILDANSQTVRSFSTATSSAGKGTFTWDGKNIAGSVVQDGTYTARMTASLVANPQVNQTETLTLTVDTTPPAITLNAPLNNAFLNVTELSVTGAITDPNLSGYNFIVTGPSGTTALDSGTQIRTEYNFGSITNLAEDTYNITADATDLGGNPAKLLSTFTIDRTPPKVNLDAPKNGDYYGNTKNAIDITGAIIEKNLDMYSLRYGAGDAPTAWTELAGGSAIPANSKLFSLKAGVSDGIADGLYTFSLYAKDKAGLEGETRVKAIIDNTLPTVAVTLPKDSDYVTKPTDVRGTISDANLDKGTLELAPGACAIAANWTVTKTITTSVTDGTLDNWKVLPADGEYCLRIKATDKSGNAAEAKTGFKIDTTPPAAPQLSGKIDNKIDGLLNWTKNSETDLAGYNLYRNNQRINTALLSEITYRDANLKEGSYTYNIKAVDFAGNESIPSNNITLKVDLTGPTVRIASPANNATVSGLVDIKGSAYKQDSFKEYRVSIGQGSDPATWTVIRRSPLSTSYGTLTQWDTTVYQDGAQFTIRLEGEDLFGNITIAQTLVAIDNTPPAPPTLLTAVPNSADVSLTWRTNGETDSAGCLIYRNDQLANIKGVVAGDLKPYLVTGTTYTDLALPDGTYRYYLVAMDRAGNTSEQSNVLSVEIDAHRPHTPIVDPATGTKLEARTLVRAESPDTDIVSVQFQYKKVSDSTWTNLGAPVTKPPFITYFDPKSLGLVYGDYQIMATAADKVGGDPSPTPITVTYTDLTPPAVPADLKARTLGEDVILSWTADTETDLDGYNMYRISNNSRTRINVTIIKANSYTDTGRLDGAYQYEITAVDTTGNESKPSDRVTAAIYAPVMTQPFSPVKDPALTLSGSNAAANASVEIAATLPSGDVTKNTVTADATGSFTLPGITLALGTNTFTATATDGAGNVSRSSDQVVVAYGSTPAAPTGVTPAVQDYDVLLTWIANSEPDILGYNVFRDGARQNTPSVVTGGSASSSNGDPGYPAANAVDGNNGTFWSTPNGSGTFTPAWWQLALPGPVLIDHLNINWVQGNWDSANNRYNLYAGKDYEVQAWSGYNWITVKKITGNDQLTNSIDISPSYRTDRIRIAIASSADVNSSQYVRISEIGCTTDNLVPSPSYTDPGLKDGNYTYTVTAVNGYGFESVPSAPAQATVGDVIPPTAPANLKATAQGSDILLDWSLTPNTEPDLNGYTVYRQNGQDWVSLGNVAATVTTFTDLALPNGTYTYHITAFDKVGNRSHPSNNATATIAVTLPPAPPQLSVTAPPESKTLIASWQHAGGTAQTYNLYRSTTQGGPYQRIALSPIQLLTYRDEGLVNGTRYYYVVTALDAQGNESTNSNEASGMPLDLVAPDRPLIFSPTLAGMPVTVYQSKVTVVGAAEPGSNVGLMRSGDLLGTTTALAEYSHITKSIDVDGYGKVVSPHGAMLVYRDYNGALWLKDLSTGKLTSVADSGGDAVWSPDGRRFAYAVNAPSGDQRIKVYNLDTAQSSFLMDDTEVDESSPSWSGDGTRIAFKSNRSGAYGVWLKNLIDNSLVQLADNVDVSLISLSPDATRVAYFDYQTNLFLVNIVDGKVSQLDDNTDQDPIAWAPDGGKVAFISYRDGNRGMYVTDFSTQATIKILGFLQNMFFQPVWSPDGTRIVYSQGESYGGSLHTVGLDGEQITLLDNLSSIDSMGWAKSGEITFIEENNVHILNLKGTFTVPNVQLIAGENQIYAIASDDSGNASQASDPVTVIFDTGHLPDLIITESDITIFPPYPKPGDNVLVTARVHNTANVAVDNATAVLYLWDGTDAPTLLSTQTIAHLDAGGEASVAVSLNAGTATGSRTVIAIADPDNLISEVQETNNYATRDLIITDQQRVSVETSLNSAQFGINQDAIVGVVLRNSGAATSGNLNVQIEDSGGNLVKLLSSGPQDLPYGLNKQLPLTWNTGTTFSGPYKVHAVVKDSTNTTTLAESATLFTILPDIQASGAITTDKQAYGAGEPVAIKVTFTNTGRNYVIPQLTAQVRVVDPQNNQLFSDVKSFSNLLPSMGGSFTSNWNTGTAPAGPYTATLELSVGDRLLVSRSAAFSILAQPLLKGTLAANPATVPVGGNFTTTYNISNQGNSAASGTVRVNIVDPDSQTLVTYLEQATAVTVNDTATGSFRFSSQGLNLKSYLATLQYVSQGQPKNLASAGIKVSDLTPPALTAVSPVAATICNTTVTIVALAADDASGLDKVEYQLDGGAWKLLPLADPARGLYSATWSPAVADNGPHTVNFRGTDRAGNTSQPVSVAFQVQFDITPPVVTATPQGGIYNTAQNVTLSANEAATIFYTTDGAVPSTASPVYSQALTISANTALKYFARDLAGNSSEVKTESYTIDTTPPVLTVSTLSDGAFTNNETLNVSGTVHDDMGVKELRINDQVVPVNAEGSFSYALILKNGANPITVIATDLAENHATDTRTVTLDKTAPNVVINTPADNSKTGDMLCTVSGTVDENCIVYVKLGNTVQNAVLDANKFTATVNLSSGNNPIEITAVDLATNSNSQKRTVLYDDQKPAVAITDPNQDIRTNQANLTIKGTASDPLTKVTVTLTMDGQTFQPDVVNGQFEQPVTFSTEKLYALVATATNEVKTSSIAQRNIIYDITPPSLTIDPVTSPTSQPNQVVTGTMEAGIQVTVSCPTAMVGNVTYPTSTTWSVAMTNLKAGDNPITAKAIDLSNNTATASAKIVYTAPQPTFNYALFGSAGVTVSGGCYTDSYVSTPPNMTRGQFKKGAVGTNSTRSCAIQLSNGSEIFGKALVGVGGNPAKGICASGGSLVYNNNTGALTAAKDMTPKADPGGGTSMGALNLSNGATKTLPAGNYRYSSVNLSGGSKLTLNGPITMHVDGNLLVSNGANVTVNSGAVTIYENGQKIDITGGAMVNNTKDPRNLVIYGASALQTVNLSGGTNIYALVYAPKATITISGGQNTYGSLIGNTVNISNGSSVHFDEVLLQP